MENTKDVKKYSEDLYNLIKEYINDNKWRCNEDKDRGIIWCHFFIKNNSVRYNISICLVVSEKHISSFSIIDLEIKTELLSNMALLLCQINTIIDRGAFVLECNNKKITFKRSVIECNSRFDKNILGKELIDLPMQMYIKYCNIINELNENKIEIEDAIKQIGLLKN